MNSVSDKKKKNLIKAVNNRILLKKDRAITAKGNIQLIKSEGMYAPPYSGVIISVGPDVKDTDYAEGVRVTFSDMAGVEFDVNGETIFSIRENDVTSIIPANWRVE